MIGERATHIRHARTISPQRLLREVRKARDEDVDMPMEDVERPITRADCANMPRPCPFVGCAHHLYLDVNDETGAIKLNFPNIDPSEMSETCVLDVADRGGLTLQEVGGLLNVSRERVRQIEDRVTRRLRPLLTDGEITS